MRVIKSGKGVSTQRKWTVQCDSCNSVLEIEEKDVTTFGELISKIHCPVCDEMFNWKTNILEGEKVPLTHCYPEDFDDNRRAYSIDDDEINEWINQGIDYFRENPDSFAHYFGSGDTLVFVFNFPDDLAYHIVVAKNYHEMYYDYSSKDYAIQEANGWKWANKGHRVIE